MNPRLFRRLLCCSLFLVSGLATLKSQEVGSTEESVLNKYGPPQMKRDRGNGETVWNYSNGNRFIVSGGIVVKAEISSPDAAPRPVEKSSSIQQQPRPVERLKPTATTPVSSSPLKRPQAASPRARLEDVSGFGLVCISIGMLIATVASIWWLVAAFRVSILWGLATLFLPLANLVFAIVHWDEAKSPVLFSLLGVGMIFAGAFIGLA